MATIDPKTKTTTSGATNDDTTSVGEGVFETPNLAQIDAQQKTKKSEEVLNLRGDSGPAPLDVLESMDESLMDEVEDDDSDIKAALKEVDDEMAKEALAKKEAGENDEATLPEESDNDLLPQVEPVPRKKTKVSDSVDSEVDKEEIEKAIEDTPVMGEIDEASARPWKAPSDFSETGLAPIEPKEIKERSLEEAEAEGAEILAATEAVKKDFEAHKEDIGTVAQATQHSVSQQSKPKPLAKVEDVLSDGLDAYFTKMPADKQAEFKKVGEETASEIWKLLKSVKVKVVEILDLIRRWLGTIPGVNRFFIEQESKLKTDQLIRLKEEGQLEEDK